MSLKKRLQALCKIASSGPYGLRLDRRMHATDGNVYVSVDVGNYAPREPIYIDPGGMARETKDISASDTVLPPHVPGGKEFDPPEVPETRVETIVDPFLMKRLFDAVTQSWEGPKASAYVSIRFYPSEQTIEVVSDKQGIRAVARTVVPLR